LHYDKPLVAVAIGVLSTIPYELFTRLMLILGIGEYSLYQLDSLIVTINRPSLSMGIIISFLVGGVVSTVFYYSLKKLGPDYIVLKAIVASLLTWATLEVLFTATIEGKYIPIRPIDDYFVHMAGSIVFGITLGLLLNKYLFKNHMKNQ